MSGNRGIALRPIRLHLDTSDYVTMHVAAHGSPEAQIRDKLKEMVQSGHLTIGLSCHILFEFLRKAAPEYRKERLQRAQLLRDLCGSNAFSYPLDLGQGHSFSTAGVWFPRCLLASFDMENLIQNLTRTVVYNLPRGERRVLSRRQNFIKWARDNPSRLGKLIAAQPWSLPLRRYIIGEITRDQANRELLSCLADPVTMYETWFQHFDPENLRTICEQFTVKFSTLLTDLRQEEERNIPELLTQIKNATAVYKNNPEARARFAQLDRDVRKARSRMLSPHQLTDQTPGGWETLVGEKSALIAARIVFAFYREKRQMKRSDVMDMIHAMYLPYTDLWRGDRAFSDLLIKHKVDYSERVVPSLSELPSRIDRERGMPGVMPA